MVSKDTIRGVGPMKMKNIVAMTMAATMVWNGTAAFGATGVKTAVLNDARISFNGGTPQTIQCYMIEGYNYIRARDTGCYQQFEYVCYTDAG